MLLVRQRGHRQRRPVRTGLATVLLAALLAAAVIGVLRSASNPGAIASDAGATADALVPPHAGAGRTGTAQPPEPARAGDAAREQAGRSPDAWTTVTVAGVGLPVSTAHGPYELDGGRAVGFSHEPEGAALAALHLLLRIDEAVGAAVFEPTLDEQVAGHADDLEALRARTRDRYAAAAALHGVPDGAPLRDHLRIEPLGWQAAILDERAAVRLLLVGPDAQGNVTTMSVRVEVEQTPDGWQLLAPARGSWDGAITLRAPRAGYEHWPETSS